MSSQPSQSAQDGSSSSQDPALLLKSTNFSRPEGSAAPQDAVTASDLLMAAYDPARLHPLAQLGDKLDYLLLDDDKTTDLPGAGTAIPSRGWSDDLCYGTGTMYLSGACRSLSHYLFCFCECAFLLGSGLFSPSNLSHLISIIWNKTRFLLFCFRHMLMFSS